MSELENPTTHSLVADFEAALGQQILDVSEAQREAAIEPYGVLDDLGRESVATIGCPSPLYLNHSDKISMFCGEVFDDTEAFF